MGGGGHGPFIGSTIPLYRDHTPHFVGSSPYIGPDTPFFVGSSPHARCGTPQGERSHMRTPTVASVQSGTLIRDHLIDSTCGTGGPLYVVHQPLISVGTGPL